MGVVLLQIRDVMNSCKILSILGALVFFLPWQAVGVVLLQVRDVAYARYCPLLVV
jgi:hypothetical protein